MSKSVISYCGKFDLLYAVTVKAVGLEAEMEMRQKIGEAVDRLEIGTKQSPTTSSRPSTKHSKEQQ